MSSNTENMIGSEVSDREYVRGVIRRHTPRGKMLEGDSSLQLLPQIDNLQSEFWKNFQSKGGKILRCNTVNDRKEFLRKLVKAQQYNFVLNTHSNLTRLLEELNVNYLNTIPLNTPVDAVIAISTILVARTGSIGFSQPISRFLTLKNIARDIIVISRIKDIVPDIEDAILKNRKNAGDAGMEFLTPSQLADNEQYSPKNPRIILILVCDEPKN